MADELKTVETIETPEKVENQEPKIEPVPETVDPKEARNQLLREMSKEYGVNLFDADGLKQFKEYQDSQKTEQEKLQEELNSFRQEKEAWQSEKLKYESKLKASELGINPEYLEDALKLANDNPDNLVDIIKKDPIFKVKEGIKIGVQNPTLDKTPTSMTEAEQYMAKDPRYRNYLKNK